MTRRGIPFVVAAPSGTGKTTVCRRLVADDPQLELSVSHTTRPARPGEVEGRDYHFVDRPRFQQLVAEDAFLEWAEYNANLYGTSRAAVAEPLDRGHDVILEIEIQGAEQVRERRADSRSIFLLPPSMESLESRLRGRGTDAEETIARRLHWAAEREIGASRSFDYVVLNDDLERCLAEVRAIIDAERAGRVAELRARHAPARVLARFAG